MNPLPQMAVLGVLALLSLAPAFGQRTYDCGNLNQRACSHADWERVNMVAGDNRACEHDLTNQDGTCVNKSRNNYGTRNSYWTGWALENQTSGIGKDAPINFITWPTSHNAYSNSTQGLGSPLYTNHVLSITDQLNGGARMLELDPKFYAMFSVPLGFPISDGAVRLCHASNTALCGLPGYGNRLFGFALKEIADWVDANPGQVVYLKLDNDRAIGNKIEEVYDEVGRYLGDRVYRVPAGGQRRWPTLSEILKAGKSILVVQHNEPGHMTSPFVWKAIGLVQEDNHPKDQNFDACTAYDGLDPVQRGLTRPTSWWDVAEGRAKTNTGDADTGMLWEEEVAKAAKCGVASIGLDFIHSLDSTYNVSQRSTPDRRMAAMIWSWAENDWGRNGPASLNAEGRWSSVPASTAFSVACAMKREYASPLQDRNWRITVAEVPWNVDLGNMQCSREFGETWEFAAPENGFQNTALAKVALGRRVWLRYTTVNVPNLTVSASSLVFRMNPGGLPPAPQTLVIGATPGTVVGSKFDPALPLIYNLPANALAQGTYALAVGLPATVSNLAPGEYTGRLDLGITNQGVNIPVRLIVKAAPRMTAAAEPAVSPQGRRVLLRLELNGGQQIAGDYKVYRLTNGTSNESGLQTVVGGSVTSTGNTSAGAKPEVTNLPLGTHWYVASYGGNERNLEASSEPFQVTITPRILPSPSAVEMRFTPGAGLPLQDVPLTGLGANPRASSPCGWLKAAISGTTLRLATTDSVRNLPVGPTTCQVTVTDALSAQGLGSLVLPVTVIVQTTLTRQPGGEITLLGENSAAREITLGTGSGTPVDVWFATSAPWLVVEPLATMKAPGAFRLVASGQALPVGRHTATVTFFSASAPELRIPVVFDRVKATVVSTRPANQPFVVDGVQYKGTTSFVWAPGSLHTLVMNTTTANGERNVPRAWATPTLVQAGGQLQFAALPGGGEVKGGFDTFYQLLPQSSTGGAVRFSPMGPSSDGYLPAGTAATVEAMPFPSHSFVDWIGSVTSTERRVNVVMDSPKTLMARFSPYELTEVTISANAPGMAATVDGVTVRLPQVFRWERGSRHWVTVGWTVGWAPGARFQFQKWSTGPGVTQTIEVGATPLQVNAIYQAEYLVAVTPSPAAGGTVSGGGWYASGSIATLQVTPANGYRFSGYSGDVRSTEANHATRVTGPLTITANFTSAGGAILTLLPPGAATNGPGQEHRLVPFVLSNVGLSAAIDARITGISVIQVVEGSGTVAVAMPMPVGFGDIAPSTTVMRQVLISWPATATRVAFTVSYQAANASKGNVTLTLNR
jgi:hypothetical protein